MKLFNRYLGGWVVSVAGNIGNDHNVIAVDGDGHISVDIETMPTISLPNINTLVFDSTLNLVVSGNHDGAGWDYITSGNVPSGELWVVQAITGFHEHAGALHAKLVKQDVSYKATLEYGTALDYYVHLRFHATIVLEEGDSIQMGLYNADNNDVFTMSVSGYKVDIS